MENSEELITSEATDAPQPPASASEQAEESSTDHAPTRQSRLPEAVFFADRVHYRRRRRSDLVEAIFCLLGIALAWGLGFVASSTTEGVAEDVLRVTVIRDLLLMPLSLVEGLTILITPIAVIGMLLFRRQVSTAIEALTTSVIAGVASYAILLLLRQLPETATAPLSVTYSENGQTASYIAINLVAIALIALFTAAGEAEAMRTIRWSYWALAVIIVIWVLRGQLTLPSAVFSVLLGRTFGSASRFVLGFQDRSASGGQIVRALLSIRITPQRIIRTDLLPAGVNLETWLVTETEHGHFHAEPHASDSAEYTIPRRPPVDGNRHYQVWDIYGVPYEITMLDPGRGMTGTLLEVWNNVRLRGLSRWVSPSVKAAAERSMLTTISAKRAGVHLPEPMGLAQAGDSIMTVMRVLPPTASLKDLAEADALTDEILDEAWKQLVFAHSHAISHRHIAPSSLVVDESSQVWLIHWDEGEVATNELNQRIDVAQMLTLLAIYVGKDRALASARRSLSEEALVSCAPVLQKAVLPSEVTASLRRSDLLDKLREEIVADTPQESVQPANLQRFAPKTMITFAVLALAAIILMGSLNFSDIVAAVKQANPIWIAIAFAFAAATWVGGAVPLVAFSQEKVKFGDSILAQVAASIVTLVAPAGIGPAALNLRFLTKQRMSTAAAVTTVTLQQISQFLVTISLLVTVLFFSGSSLSVSLPYGAIIAGVAVVALVVIICISIPKVRKFIWSKIEPTWKQVYPRLMWVAGQPQRILAVLAGNMLMNIGFVGAFWASLKAMGGSLNLVTLSITYLASNSLGSVVPSPGGIGPVEAALTGGLQVAGIAVSIALPTAIIYRLVTFYGRAPFGWVALKIMQKRNLI